MSEGYRRANPCFKRERTTELESLDRFDLMVGAEEIECVRAFPHKAYKAKHLMWGREYLQFHLSPPSRGENGARGGNSIADLHKMAHHFFTVSTDPNVQLHEKVRPFLDEPVRDVRTLALLNAQLEDMLAQGGSHPVYLLDSVWRRYGTTALFFGENQNRSLFETLKGERRSLRNPIKVRRREGDENAIETMLGNLLYSLPIKSQGKFYRFVQGEWYEVDQSRFGPIRNVLRRVLLPTGRLPLPDYEYRDAETEGEGANYKEANYNRRVISALTPPWQGILIDRLSLYLGDFHHSFEFADQILFNDSQIYLVHVKRAGANSLSHHREQVERCAEYLATELKRDSRNLLVQGVVNHLYFDRTGSSTKTNGQGTRPTHGDEYLKLYKKAAQREGETFEAFTK